MKDQISKECGEVENPIAAKADGTDDKHLTRVGRIEKRLEELRENAKATN